MTSPARFAGPDRITRAADLDAAPVGTVLVAPGGRYAMHAAAGWFELVPTWGPPIITPDDLLGADVITWGPSTFPDPWADTPADPTY